MKARSLIVITAILACASANAAPEAPPMQGSRDPWSGWSASVEFGPSWRTTKFEGRPSIPNTIGGALGLTLRRSIARNFFLAASSQVAITAQLGGRTNGTIGDWSGTELFPIIPSAGFRIGNVHLMVGYPMFSTLTLLSTAAGDQEVKYTGGRFWQGSIFVETESGLFGAQYRTGTYKTEQVGSVEADLDPRMKSGGFTLLFVLPF